MQRCVSALKLREEAEEPEIRSASAYAMERAVLKLHSLDPRTKQTALEHAKQAIDLADLEATVDPPFAILYQMRARLLLTALHTKTGRVDDRGGFLGLLCREAGDV